MKASPCLSLQAVYEEDLIHRQPGDGSTQSRLESSFPIVEEWITEERAAEGLQSREDDSSDSSVTRIVVGELKSEVLEQIASPPGRLQLCRYLSIAQSALLSASLTSLICKSLWHIRTTMSLNAF